MKLIMLLLPLLASQTDAASDNSRCYKTHGLKVCSHCHKVLPHPGYYGTITSRTDTTYLCTKCSYQHLSSQRGITPAHNGLDDSIVCPRCDGRGTEDEQVCRICHGEGSMKLAQDPTPRSCPKPSAPPSRQQFYLPYTINIVKVDNDLDTPRDPVHTIEVYTAEIPCDAEPACRFRQRYIDNGEKALPKRPSSTAGYCSTCECTGEVDEEGQGCPLLGVYDKMSSAVRPPAWVAAHWKRNRGTWYRSRGPHVFYIRFNNVTKRWCLYDNYDNDNKDRWIYATTARSTNPINGKWMLHGKCSACEGTGKRHGRCPSCCDDCTVSDVGCTCNCGLPCEVCGVSGKVWEDRIWPAI